MTELARQTDADLDKFYTPRWPVRLLLDNWGAVEPYDTVAEPCCGRGDICDVLRGYGCGVEASDIHPDRRAVQRYDATEADARLTPVAESADSIVTNPPYAADAGTAGDVLKPLVQSGRPVAALLRITWMEPCVDRQWAWCAPEGSEMHPQRVWVLPRVDYHRPGNDDRAGNPATSVWVIWEPQSSGPCVTRHFSKRARDRYQGQRSLLEVAE